MDLVEVDRVDPQPAERTLQRPHQIVAARIVGDRRGDPALGREHHPRAQSRRGGEDLAEQRLGVAEPRRAVEAVDVGGIEQRHTRVERRLDQRAAVLRADRGEAPHPPGDGGDHDSALAERT